MFSSQKARPPVTFPFNSQTDSDLHKLFLAGGALCKQIQSIHCAHRQALLRCLQQFLWPTQTQCNALLLQESTHNLSRVNIQGYKHAGAHSEIL